MLTSEEKPQPGVSRIHGPRQILGELRRILVKVNRATVYRARTADERTWLIHAGDLLAQLIDRGSKLPLPPDRRRRVRKSGLFEGV